MVQSICKVYSVFTSSQADFKLDSEFSSCRHCPHAAHCNFKCYYHVARETVLPQEEQSISKTLSTLQVVQSCFKVHCSFFSCVVYLHGAQYFFKLFSLFSTCPVQFHAVQSILLLHSMQTLRNACEQCKKACYARNSSGTVS